MNLGDAEGFELFRDEWGVPHLRAGDASALAYAQGRVTALDRAWQIEVERHRMLGSSAALLGAESLGWDRFARQARLADTARRCYEALDAPTRAWVGAYVDGVNDGLGQPGGRAPEFARAGAAPGRWEPWTPLGVWLSTHVLFAGFPGKLWRDEVVRRLGADAVELFATDGPGTSGSNGWLVAGEDRTLIAGDPHRFIEDPGVYQQIRLACPEFDVVGLAVPGVPGIGHFGHTGGVAWAITNAMADYQDLYRERLRRTGEGGVEALGPDGWRPAHAHLEDGVEVVETERGVVVIGGPDDGEGISLRQPARVYADLGFAALPDLLRARTVADVDRAFDRWAEPVNVVLAADTEGGLLHRVAGTVPVRDPENMLRVVPAWEERYAWRGRYAPMPRAGIGADGVAVMANERSLAAPLGIEFAPPHRARRIAALLAGQVAWDADGMAAVHTDTELASAEPLLKLVEALDGLDGDAARLRASLLNWDRRMAAGSVRAAAYARVRSGVVRRLAAHPHFAPLTGLMPAYPEVFRPWLALVPRVAFGLENLLATGRLPYEERLAAVRAALLEVAAEAAGATWGELHRLAPWQALADPGAEWPGLDGDHDCVLSTSSVPGVTDLSARGPAARYVWDLARREDSRWIVPFGASGVPGTPHHRDQLPLWLRGELAPVTTDFDRLTKENPVPRTTDATDVTDVTDAAAATVYEQYVEGLGTFRLAPVDPAGDDIDVLHGWVREERATFWGMTGIGRDDVRDIYAHMAGLATHHAFLVRLDGTPVALFQTYEPEADRVSECYEVRDGDVGVHLLVAPAGGAGAVRGFTGALVGVLTSYALDGLGRKRIVAEPDARNEKAIALFSRVGFELAGEIVLPEVKLPEVHLVEKRAQLAFYTR
ncbi:GNAT family N-acetyltransferase [Streptomyces longispororuber]|uniref:GNAT family N-acetyltransferase n=1 Tax=Streptomyces longispororuber TaxID=68230 RepID=UPI00210F017D|nr:GNAT family N-acetyltransferase [Streptomyces longispororuber]MCQ4214006.1 GNAT family N-acetyltransferase [Streptomyces longispororuber]